MVLNVAYSLFMIVEMSIQIPNRLFSDRKRIRHLAVCEWKFLELSNSCLELSEAVK